MSKTYKIKGSPAEDYHHGDGEAWAAASGETLLAIIYVPVYYPQHDGELPEWVSDVHVVMPGLVLDEFDIGAIRIGRLSWVVEAAITSGRISSWPTEQEARDITQEARNLLLAAKKKFLERQKQKYSAVGEVIEGEVRGWEFIPNV